MTSISQTITGFVNQSIRLGFIDQMDHYYIRNQLLALLQLKEFDKKIDVSGQSPSQASKELLDLLDDLVEYAIEQELIEDLPSAKDVFESKVMNLILPLPSQVNQEFWKQYENDPQTATDYYYNFSKQSNYVKTREVAKNIVFDYPTDFGTLQISINLSKPEKDPKEIAMAKERSFDYPTNALSIENEGYEGHTTHPGRSNHRVIRLPLSQETWGFQYSPYSYYNEHSIFFSFDHRPMKVNTQSIRNLLDIITYFPHYFIGSNAGLPIVGGSILHQDHYQGGKHKFALDTAEDFYTFKLRAFPEIKASLVKWPMSTIRLVSKNKDQLAEAGGWIMDQWENYENKALLIYKETEGRPHNAVTPLTRRDGQDYVLDLVLRNNYTNEEYPDGVFHPHPAVQHIKKENIGLIEVLGLAILPPRLKEEMAQVKAYWLDTSNKIRRIHKEWADQVLLQRGRIRPEEVDQVLQQELGEIFLEVLKNAGVFKMDDEGRQAFIEFASKLSQ